MKAFFFFILKVIAQQTLNSLNDINGKVVLDQFELTRDKFVIYENTKRCEIHRKSGENSILR